MPRPHRRIAAIASFRDCLSGVAATEFALVFPLLVMLFFGVVEGADALAANRRAALAANTLADLAAQETEIMESSVDDLFRGVGQILEAGEGAVSVRLVSVIADEDGDPVVHWSRGNHETAPYVPGAPYDGLPDAALLDPNASMIVAELSYEYRSKLTEHFIPPLTIEKFAARWPRQSLRVRLCKAPGDCTS